MSTPEEQVQWVLWLPELQSLMAVQRHFRMQYERQPPMWKSIQFWDNKLRTTGSLLCVPGKTWTSEENNNRIREAFQRSLHKSICAASLQLCTNSMFNSARCATKKALPKSIQDSNDLCTKTE
jgi:hypothetical protein